MCGSSHKGNRKTACTSAIAPSLPFPFPAVGPTPHPFQKAEPACFGEGVGGSADSQHKGMPVSVLGTCSELAACHNNNTTELTRAVDTNKTRSSFNYKKAAFQYSIIFYCQIQMADVKYSAED